MKIEEIKAVIEASMLKTTNGYATKGNMIAATAIHDAYLCLIEEIQKNFEKSEKVVDIGTKN